MPDKLVIVSEYDFSPVGIDIGGPPTSPFDRYPYVSDGVILWCYQGYRAPGGFKMGVVDANSRTWGHMTCYGTSTRRSV